MPWTRHYKKKGNKYGAKKTFFGGYVYDSKLEAAEAEQIELRILAQEVESYTRQHRLDLYIGESRICSYKIDFRAVRTDGVIEYIEVKGLPTEVWKLKWKMTQALFDELTEGEKAVLILSTKDSRTVVLRNQAYLDAQ